MKKIISALVILTVFVMIFSLAACGKKEGNDIKDEMSTVKDEGMSMLDDLSSVASDIDEGLTQGGNVTKDNSSTGLFDTMTTESTTGHSSTTKPTTDEADKTTISADDILQ